MPISKGYNPDVLTCISNLSSDEVFTPPKVVNNMLDLLPSKIWSDNKIKFLDPVSKSGVFLREIAKRLISGLEEKIPDLQKRLNHIYKNQLYGIAITELTSLLSRRSVYCSKIANGKYSMCNSFETFDGNIIFKKTKHKWVNEKCSYCGASREGYDRGTKLETYAYQFIHTNNSEDIFKMKFDVIVGNPPYQLNDGGHGVSASPIYHKFIQQAKKLNPKHLVMIIPSRWMAGGKGLDSFRDEMLNDRKIKKIVDFHDAADCFPGVEIKGGVCYFHRELDYEGDCEVEPVLAKKSLKPMRRNLGKYDIFVRFNQSVTILEKVLCKTTEFISSVISPRKPFGFPTCFKEYRGDPFKNSIKIFAHKKIGWVNPKKITINAGWINKYKVLISKAYNGGYSYPHQIINVPILAGKRSCCTETYLVCGPFNTRKESLNFHKYVCTKFFRFMVSIRKITQDNTKNRFDFVPLVDLNKSWSDDALYKKYKLSTKEIEFIESMIRPMEKNND